MLINGFTILAQIINFLILVALLKKFLYQPILKAIAQRELTITKRVRETSLQLQDAENQALLYQKKQKELEQKKEALLSQAQQEVIAIKKRLLQQAQSEVEEKKISWYQELEQEKQAYLVELQKQIVQQVMLITRHILTDLAGTDLEEQIVKIFIQQLKDSKLPLSENNQESLVIKTSFVLTSPQKQKLLDALHQTISPELKIEFQIVPELNCGIELTTQSYQLAWNLEQYLHRLEQALVGVQGLHSKM